MKFEPFELERIQSIWEHQVDYNLSESGVHPLSFTELTGGDPAALARLANQELGYSQTNGTVALRERIAALYPGTTPDHILVTNGTAEANYVTIWSLLEADDEIVLMLPNYMQIWGLARGFRGQVKPFYLREKDAWSPDLDELRRAISPKTRLIAVCNPNNPTGAILSESARQAIVEAAASVGAWLLADEVYQGAEREDAHTPSFWGSYEKVIVTNGLSKAYGLPGLRIGWIVAPPEITARLWSYRDYTTIAPGNLSDHIAQLALVPETRAWILARTRQILRTNYPLVAEWLQAHAEMFQFTPPRAGAIVFMRYARDFNSTALTDKLREEQSVLIVPGDYFGLDHHLRLGYGSPAEYLQTGLKRIHDCLLKL